MINDYNWAPLGAEQAPQFPVEHLPADCAALVQHVSACCAFPVDYAVCAL